MERNRAESSVFRAAVESGAAGVPPAQEASRPAAGQSITKKLDLRTVKVWSPPTALWHHEPRTNRIRGFDGRSRISHGCSLAKGQDLACRLVLPFSWEEHKKAHPGVHVPYQFPIDWDNVD